MNLLTVGIAALAWGMAQVASSGSVTGTIREDGRPAAGIRVAAMAVPGVIRSTNDASVLESITQTDSNGRYRLDIPPGRYYIVAGSVSSPTFYPGTLAQNAASMVTVTQDSSAFAGVDFTLNSASKVVAGRSAIVGGRVCCRVSARIVLEDGSPLPPNLNVTAVATYAGGVHTRPVMSEETFALSVPPSTPFQVAVDGLPPGYVFKSVTHAGKDVGLSPVTVNGDSPSRTSPTGPVVFDPATLTLTIGYLPVSALEKVTVRGNVANVASELNGTNLILASTMPNGPKLEARIQPDHSFDVSSIPVGAYRAGVRTVSGNEFLSWTTINIRGDISNLSIDFRNNPFLEFERFAPPHSVFTDGKPAAVTGVVTQRLTKLYDTDRAAYFRMDVKDERTGAVTPWAIYVARDWQVPNIRVGEKLTVPGVLSTDGTNRFSASPF